MVDNRNAFVEASTFVVEFPVLITLFQYLGIFTRPTQPAEVIGNLQ